MSILWYYSNTILLMKWLMKYTNYIVLKWYIMVLCSNINAMILL